MRTLNNEDWKSIVWSATSLISEMVVPLREIKKFKTAVKADHLG